MALNFSHRIGGNGGFDFHYYGGTDGRVMQKIKVWSGYNTLKAIEVTLSDGVPKLFGNPNQGGKVGGVREFSFNPGERVTRLSLWGNGAGSRSGWIFFETTQGRRFDFGMYSWGKKREYPQDVASGIWVGVTGASAWDVDCLGVVFLQPINSCKLSDVKYPTLQFRGTSGGGGSASITPTTPTKSFNLRSTADVEDRSSTQQLAWEVADQLNFDNVSHSWALSNTDANLLQFIDTSSISVRARTPALAVVDNVVGWQPSDSDTESSSLSSTSSLSRPWSRGRPDYLLPSESLTLSAPTYRGDVRSLAFDGSVNITTTTGGRFSFRGVKGQFSGQSYVAAITIQ